MRVNTMSLVSILFTGVFCSLATSDCRSQTYFVNQGFPTYLHKLKLDCTCAECCDISVVGPHTDFGSSIAISPDGHLYGINDDLYQIDTLTGTSSFF